ncbi:MULTISPECIES: efflux RND transporter periplasmic adaptor subunit [Sporomusa]|uniref:efflux RND transporter periplasmic adaptor subunit n=1 Tax=Sporomusa TaxID=2375 RepID=UPI001668E889|nr:MULTISPECIES: efflux RND transporter periplasmic adaptor subunit [Sporomusa]MCM0759579.1 efflux RND transporter periplasmic adaptor subunit [Sporomusa sphaeroides DSM 2875]
MPPLYPITKLSGKRLYYGLAAAIAGLCIIGFGFWKLHSQPPAVAEEIPLVRTAVIGAANASQNYLYSGEVRGRYESQLAFQVTGKISRRNVELGSTVKAGDVLMQIDPRDLEQTVNTTSAQVSSAQSQLKLAVSNLHRYRQLYAQNAISRAQLDQYENACEVAQAALRQATSQHVQGANQLDYSLLYADKDGVISAITAEAGQVVSAGQPVITIVQEGEREAAISVPENRIEEIRNASQLTVTFWALPQATVAGKLREIAPVADAITRTYKVRISLIDPPPQVKLGMTASVHLPSSGNQSITMVPLSAIYQTNTTPCVWVINNYTATLRPVQIGRFGNGQVQIIDGLHPGDTIVTAGVHKLREGQTVQLMEGNTP